MRLSPVLAARLAVTDYRITPTIDHGLAVSFRSSSTVLFHSRSAKNAFSSLFPLFSTCFYPFYLFSLSFYPPLSKASWPHQEKTKASRQPPLPQSIIIEEEKFATSLAKRLSSKQREPPQVFDGAWLKERHTSTIILPASLTMGLKIS